MEPPGSSKVTVQYFDPDGVFPLLSSHLASRLPLRNLNWQSPSRPLRRIKSLHVEFTSQGPTSSSGSVSLEPEKNNDAELSRRHQVPGLKTSPYLKLYLLRCDDKEQYKEKSKAAIRAWVKEVAEAKQRNDHDAFEWLILHVVLPNTHAAGEPRWREGLPKEPDEPKERPKSSSKWPTKGSRTVFDRLRSDFNESKSGPDRVAQVRLTMDDVSAELVPAAADAAPHVWEESSAERENAWHDLVMKLKGLILVPFDARVRQYEADIAVQESRRSLPGWNFCTFFVHKEGLAIALEAIGLVEAALAVYDELSLDLETVVHDIASGAAQKTATSFAAVTPDIRDRLLAGGTVELANEDYRRKIVTSDISVFDFYCYGFMRQLSLLARVANVKSATPSGDVEGRDGGQDLVLIGEMCWRAGTFIHNNSRVLRRDLRRQNDADPEGLVNSWVCAVADSVLAGTEVRLIEQLTSRGDDRGSTAHPNIAGQVPKRASSLAVRPKRPDAHGQLEQAVPGQAELATYRADLIMIRRRAIESAARRLGWSITPDEPVRSDSGERHLSPQLARILSSEANFRHEMERVCLQAIQHYSLATHYRAVLAIQADLGILYWQQDEPQKALECLQNIALGDSRDPAREKLFEVYVTCLQKLGRDKEHAQAVLKFASKASQLNGAPGVCTRLLTNLVRSGTIQHEVERPMHDFFDDIEVRPGIQRCEDRHGFSLVLAFKSLLTESLQFDRISVSLISVADAKEELILLSNDNGTVVEPGPVEISVRADVACSGAYFIQQVRLAAGQLRFVHDFNPSLKVPTLIVGEGDLHAVNDKEELRRPWTLIYPANGDLDVEFDLSKDIDVSQRRSLELQLVGGSVDIRQIDLKLRPQAAGMRLHVAEAEVEGIHRNDQGRLSFGHLRAGNRAKLRIPYTMENASLAVQVAIRCEAVCQTDTGSYTFIATARLSTVLPLVVDVEDSFQADALISNYSISTVNDKPVMVESARLSSSPAYDIENPSTSPLPTVLVHQEQPVRLVYRVRRTSAAIPSNPAETRLALQVTYRIVEDVVRHSISQQLEADLSATSFHHLKRLLLPHLAGRLRSVYRAIELARAAVLRRCTVPVFELMDWGNITTNDGLLAWLAQWHATHSHVGFCQAEGLTRRMTVAVDVPRPDFVHSARVKRESSSPALLLGQCVEATVEINSTRDWGNGRRLDTEFVADVHAEPSTWLIGGVKRARFPVGSSSSSRHTMGVTLVPLQAGLHPLPRIDVHPVSGSLADADAVTSVTHCASASEVVHILRESPQTRVHVAGTKTSAAAVALQA